jgi:hypothetical protein
MTEVCRSFPESIHYATTVSFQVLSNSLFFNLLTVRYYMVFILTVSYRIQREIMLHVRNKINIFSIRTGVVSFRDTRQRRVELCVTTVCGALLYVLKTRTAEQGSLVIE